MKQVVRQGNDETFKERSHQNALSPPDVFWLVVALDFYSFENFNFPLNSKIIKSSHWWSYGPTCYCLSKRLHSWKAAQDDMWWFDIILVLFTSQNLYRIWPWWRSHSWCYAHEVDVPPCSPKFTVNIGEAKRVLHHLVNSQFRLFYFKTTYPTAQFSAVSYSSIQCHIHFSDYFKWMQALSSLNRDFAISFKA